MNIFRLLSLLFILSPGLAPASFLEAGIVGDITFFPWSGDGDREVERLICIASAENARPEAPPNGRDERLPYRVRVDSLDRPGFFELFRNGDTSAPLSGRLAVEIAHEDLFGGDDHDLSAGVYEFVNHAGQYRTCPYGLNSLFEFEIDDDEFEGKQGGIYEGLFELTVEGNGGAEYSTQTFVLSVEVAGGSEVRISGLDNVSFGAANGGAAVTVVESFCVFSSSGGYRLSASSPDQAADGTLRLRNAAADALLPVSMLFDDGVGAPVALGSVPVAGVSNASLADCGGSDNAQITFDIALEPLQAAPTGTYSQTLTLTVEPE